MASIPQFPQDFFDENLRPRFIVVLNGGVILYGKAPFLLTFLERTFSCGAGKNGVVAFMGEEKLQEGGDQTAKTTLDWPKPDASDSELLEWMKKLKQGGLQRIHVVEKGAAPKREDSKLWVLKSSDRKPIALDSEGLIFLFDEGGVNIYTDDLIALLRERIPRDDGKVWPYAIHGKPYFE